MLRRTTTAVLVGLTALASLVALVVLPAAPASAAPRPADDAYTLIAGGTYTLDPLANDTTTPFSVGALRICGLQSYDSRRVYVEVVDDQLVVEVIRDFRGQTPVVYDACQGDARQSAVVSLQVVRVSDLTARKKPGVKGRVVFTNPNTFGVAVSWGSVTSGRPDATRVVPARGRLVVPTRRTAVFWVATLTYEGAVITSGDGVVRRLQKKK